MSKSSKKEWLIPCALVAVTFFVYLQIVGHGFVSYDDDVYITNNPRVQAGLNAQSIAWSFASTEAANWHPVTWLSHILDYELYGLDASGHHLTNLLLHLANVVLLFLLLHTMTKALWLSAFVAALFALHPLNVESVAWIAERKNVLSTFFWLLAMLAYVWYARRPESKRYVTVLVLLALGLMSKPMVVTLPLVLLLVDYWPLGRLKIPQASLAPAEKTSAAQKRRKEPEKKTSYPLRTPQQLVIEKAPMLLLVAASCLITVIAQKKGGAVGTVEAFPILSRVANALLSYIQYLYRMIWPADLAVFYSHPQHSIAVWQVMASTVVLVAITWLALRTAKRFRYLIVGWLWYLGTLVPVIGLVQVGLQSSADRYAYIPLIGVFLVIAWGSTEVAKRLGLSKHVMAGLGACLLVALTTVTFRQEAHWRNSSALFEQALRVTEGNYVAHMNMGEMMAQQGKTDDALRHFTRGVEINPNYAHAQHNLGMALVQKGRIDQAIEHFIRAVEIDPAFFDAYNKLGAALAAKGRLDEAIAYFTKTIEIDPKYASAYANLGIALDQQGKRDEAIKNYNFALQFGRDNSLAAQMHYRIGILLAKRGESQLAIEHYQKALELKPDLAAARQGLDNLLGGKQDKTAR